MNTDNKISLDIEEILKKDSEGYKRCQRLRKQAINAKPHICVERAKIVTKAYQQTEGEHILSRRAKAIDAILKEMSIFILDEELIVGHIASMQRSAPLYPEFAVDFIGEEIDIFETRAEDKMIVTEDVKKVFINEVWPYWNGKTYYKRFMSHDTEDVAVHRDIGTVILQPFENGGTGHVALDFEKVLRIGIDGIKKLILERKNKINEWTKEEIRKDMFYDAAIKMCDSVIFFANRYSKLALEMSKSEKNEKRKQELLKISKICKRVPEFPAGSFYEALQSFWFIQIVMQIYDNGDSITPGRFDQYMYPYYEKDILNNIITKEKAQELLESIWIKFIEPIKLYSCSGTSANSGYPRGQNLVVSGIGVDGRDATNDLTYRCLEAHSHILFNQPNFSVRLHNKSPHALIKRVCECIRLGNGMPQIINDEVYIKGMLSLGVTIKDARDYVAVGCVEITPLHNGGRLNGGYVNLPKLLELALNNGKCKLTGRQVGPKTGDPTKFKTFNEVKLAYRKQVFHCIDKLVKWVNKIDMVNEDIMPTPLISILLDGCIENGMDLTSGSAKYNWTSPYAVGVADVGDSLLVIKKLVFDKKTLTMRELCEILDKNFEGKEDLRQYILNKITKYGNDDEEADSMVKFASDVFFDALNGRECYRGGPFVPAMIPVTAYLACGKVTAATPDGRKCCDPLADGISPYYGADKNGPTAAIKSVSRIDHLRTMGGVIYNQKINPMVISTNEGMKKWIDLIRTVIQLEIGHIQFNVVDEKILRDAQKNPEKYESLVVRVAGYSAFWNELSEEVQESIIKRTEYLGV